MRACRGRCLGRAWHGHGSEQRNKDRLHQHLQWTGGIVPELHGLAHWAAMAHIQCDQLRSVAGGGQSLGNDQDYAISQMSRPIEGKHRPRWPEGLRSTKSGRQAINANPSQALGFRVRSSQDGEYTWNTARLIHVDPEDARMSMC